MGVPYNSLLKFKQSKRQRHENQLAYWHEDSNSWRHYNYYVLRNEIIMKVKLGSVMRTLFYVKMFFVSKSFRVADFQKCIKGCVLYRYLSYCNSSVNDNHTDNRNWLGVSIFRLGDRLGLINHIQFGANFEEKYNIWKTFKLDALLCK